MTRKKYTHRRNELMQAYIEQRGTPNRKQRARFNELYDKAEASGWDGCPPANDVEAHKRREYYKTRERYKGREYYTSRGKRHWRVVTRSRVVQKFRMVMGKKEDYAPYAYLLDYIGVRPLSEFGWLCVGDTQEQMRKARPKG